MTGNGSSGTGHIDILNIRLPFIDFGTNQLNDIRINAGMGNKYPVLPDVVFAFQKIIRVSLKSVCRPAAIFLRGQHIAV